MSFIIDHRPNRHRCRRCLQFAFSFIVPLLSDYDETRKAQVNLKSTTTQRMKPSTEKPVKKCHGRVTNSVSDLNNVNEQHHNVLNKQNKQHEVVIIAKKMNALTKAALICAVLAAQVVAFSPGPHPLKVDVFRPTRLGYRNYYDILMDMDTKPTTATSPTTTRRKQLQQQHKNRKRSRTSVTPPKLHDATFTTLDVDADRMPLSILLEPPAPPFAIVKDQEQQQHDLTPPSGHVSKRMTSTASRATKRSSPITQLFNVQDYNHHVLNSAPNELCIIRFHAPWCQVCRTTNVAWERMASKLLKMNSTTRRVKFLAVNLDGKNEEAVELKDMLQIEGVPQGVIHHENDGVFGQKVVLNRKNLGVLKKQLENYLTNDLGADMFLYALKKET